MKKVLGLIIFSILSSEVHALPEQAQVSSGCAEFQRPDAESLVISTSEKVIINWERFSIAQKESVQFAQPSAQSCVLNRVTGGDPSQILGRLSANGKVFLVNPQGVYFGPDAVVNTGSFLVSTLNILDTDFLNERYRFSVDPGCDRSSIINEGMICASPEGFVAFCAPVVENRGVVRAQAGKVLFASAERMTLDFAGDGLVRFALEGDLEQAVIENYGEIHAAQGNVELSMRTAKSLIKTVVNTDGITPATSIEECNGVIRLVGGSSHVTAKNVRIEGEQGTRVVVGGRIDARQEKKGEKGGLVQVLGDHTHLEGAYIDVSGHAGGGEVLVGGDYMGGGTVRRALTSGMDFGSEIHADALHDGDGGRVILWSDERTVFDGEIWTRGGPEGGDGGFVETSCHGDQPIMNIFPRAVGPVYGEAPLGKRGDWLLDPASINISTSGSATLASCQAPNCATTGALVLNPSAFTGSTSNISLCAQNTTTSSITISSPIVMTVAGVSLTFTAGSTSAGEITLSSNVTTVGGAMTFNGAFFCNTAPTVDTTNGGGTAAGANITINGTIDGNHTLYLYGGTSGTVTLNGVTGGIGPLIGLNTIGKTINQPYSVTTNTGPVSHTGSSAINIGGNITTSGQAITLTGPVALTGAVTLDPTNAGGTPAGANITLSSTVNGAQALTLTGGTGGTVSFGAVGGTTPLTSLSVTGSTITQNSTVNVSSGGVTYNGGSAISMGGNLTSAGSAMAFTGPVTLTTNVTIDLTNGGASPLGANGVRFFSSVDGAHNLTLTTGTQGLAFFNAAGQTTPLASYTATGLTLLSVGNLRTTGAVTQTATSVIDLSNTIKTAGSPITLTGPVVRDITNAVLDTTNGGSSPAGANISLSSTVDGAFSLGMTAGTGGTISFGAVGSSTVVTALTASGATVTQNLSAKATGAISYTGSSGINIGGNITTSGSTIGLTGAVTLTGASTIDPTNAGGSAAGANVTFSSTINGAQALTITGGTSSTVSFGAVGATTALTSFTATGATITQSSTAKTTGALSYTGTSAINLGGNITTSGGVITMTGPVPLSGSRTLDTTNAGATPAGANISFSSTINNADALTLTGGTGGTVTLGGAVGGTTALTSLTATGATITQSSTAKTTGALSYTGTTAINLGGNITTSGGVVTLTGPVVLNAGVTIDPTNAGGTAAGANITLSSTVNGAQALTLTGGTGGTVSFGAAGGTTTLNSLTATGATITQSSSAKTTGAISYTGSSGINIGGNITTSGSTIGLTGAVTLTGASTIDPTNAGGSAAGANVTFSSTINGAQALTITGGTSSTVSFGAVGATTALTSFTATGATITQSSTAKTTGALSYTGATAINLGGNVTTSGGAITMTGPVTLNTGLTLDTTNGGGTAAGANITFSSTLNGAHALTLLGGTTGTVSLNVVGNAALLTSLTATAATVTMNSFIDTTGFVSFTGSSAINLYPSIATNGGAITLTGPVNLLNGPLTLDTTYAGVVPAGANITFSSTIDGGHNLILKGGTGGVVSFGTVGGIASVYSLTASGATITQGGSVTTNNGGASGYVNYTASAAINIGGNIATQGGVITMTGPATLTANSLMDTTNAGGTPAGANISFSSTVNGAQSLTLTGGTSGNVSVSGVLGGSTALSALTVTGNALTFANIGGASAGVTGTTSMNALGAINFSGTTYNANTQSYTAATNFNMNAGALTTFTSNGNPITFTTGTIELSAGTNLTMNSTNGNITVGNVDAVTGNLSTLTLNGGTGSVQVGAIGTATSNEFTLVSLTGGNLLLTGNIVTNTLSLNPGASNTIFLGANITTNNTAVSFPQPVIRNTTNNVTVSTGSTGANITFSSTLDGDVAGTRNLTLSAGVGTVTFTGAVGSSTTLNVLTATGATITQSATVKTAGAVSYTGSTAINLGGNITTAGGAVSMTGATALTANTTVDTTNAGGTAAGANITFGNTLNGAHTLTLTGGTSGTVLLSGAVGGTTALTSLTATGATIFQSSTAKTTGALSYTGTILISLGGNVTTSGGAVTMTGATTLTGSTTVDTTNTGGTAAGANITFTSILNGAQALTLTGGTGGIVLFSGAVGGATPLLSLTATSGTITQSSTVQTTGAVSYTEDSD